MILLGLTLTSCGSSGSEPDVAGGTTTTGVDVTAHQEFLAEGDAVCAEAQVEAAELARRAQELQARRGTISDSELLESAADVWNDQIELAERFRDRLIDLDAPPEDEVQVDVFLETLDEGIEIARVIKASLDDGKDPPQALVQSYGSVAVRGNTLAQAFGFQVCGRSA